MDRASNWRNALDICVVRMFLSSILALFSMQWSFFGVGIVHNFQYLHIGLWNPRFIPLVVSFAILPPLVYKLVVVECIMLFTSFQIFQEPWSTWAPMPIRLQMANVENPFKIWRTWLYTRFVTRQLLLFQPLFCLQIRHFFLVICSTRMEKVTWSFSKVKN